MIIEPFDTDADRLNKFEFGVDGLEYWETEMWFLRLYISHEDDKSAAAVVAVNQFLEKHKHFGIKLQIVDINSQTEMAERDGVKQTPVLLKVDPPPLRALLPKRWDPMAIAAELEA